METQVSKEAVLNATGKDWDTWFTMIDNFGGIALDHKGIVAILKEKSSLNGWWQQMVTVEYEKARGKRQRHEMVDGFQISKSKTFPFPVASVFEAWADKNIRSQWIDNPQFHVRKANPHISLRITWVDGESHLDVYFYPKNGSTQVSINHGKLSSSQIAEKMKAYWAEQLNQLAAFLMQEDKK